MQQTEQRGQKKSEMIDKEKGYRKLLIWKKARELVSVIYALTENFPRSEEFGLKSQLRRASVSVVLNIVEGYRRSSRKEFYHFIDIALGSATEIEAALELCLDLKFISEAEYKRVEQKRGEVAFLLYSFRESIK